MRYVLSVFLLFFFLRGYSQGKFPVPVICLNNEVITSQQVDAYTKEGRIKQVRVGATEEERQQLIKKYGDKIPTGKMDIMVVTLFTDEEKRVHDQENVRRAVARKSQEFLIKVNDTAKGSILTIADNKIIQLSDLKGKVVVLAFWDGSCESCTSLFDELPSKVLQPNAKRNFVFVAIAKGEGLDRISDRNAALAKLGTNIKVAIDPDSNVWSKYARGDVPKLFLLDQNGIVKYESAGYNAMTLDQLQIEIGKLFKD